MKKSNYLLNPYTIYWIALIPLKGVATKKDAETASKIVSNSKSYFSSSKQSIYTHLPNKEKGNQIIKLLKNKLSKTYKVYLFTDKQFGMASKDGNLKINSTGNLIPLTSKQLKEAVNV